MKFWSALWPGQHGPTTRNAWRYGLPGMLLLTLLVLHQLIPSPQDPFWQAVHQSFHGGWFALITWLLCALLQGRWPALAGARWPALLGVLLLALTLAVLTESVQLFTARSASVQDVMFNTGGALTALLFWRVAAGGSAVTLLLPLAAALLLATWQPVWRELGWQSYQAQLAPRLLAPDHWQSNVLVRSDSVLHRVSAPADWPEYGGAPVYALQFGDQRWPSVTLPAPRLDLTGEGTLVLDYFLMDTGHALDGEPLPLTLHILVADEAGTEIVRPGEIKPGAGQVRWPLASLRPDGWQPGTRLRTLGIHSTRAHQGRVLLIASLHLEP